MRKAICTLAVGVLAMGVLATRVGSQAKPASAFSQLKTLVGTWEATEPNGKAFVNTIRLVSSGTALEETFQSSQDDQMVTLYTPDGNRVALTHYCSMGNQPRMETPVLAANQSVFDFSFVGATNLANSADAHMHHMILQIADRDHFTETWTFTEKGKQDTETFHFTRKK